MYTLGDVFIGDYPPVEYFGANPDVYNARYNLQGYPGIRIKMPSLTPILSGADGFVLETGFEEAGKGKFITIVHDGFLTTYGHLNDILVTKDEKVVTGQLIAHSNQSGLTDIACLYFGVAPCDGSGNKTESNGFDGYIDPMGELINWDVKGLKEPVVRSEVLDKMTLGSKEYTALHAQATNYRVILSFLKQFTVFDEFLKEEGRAPINIEATPDDPTGGDAITFYLREVADEFENLNKDVEDLTKELEEEKQHKIITTPDSIKPRVEKNTNFMIRFLYAIKDFVFTK